ncbi:MAG: hypothetical protein IIA88_11980, partial [Bacteroidetes bacterium]|nr:hypothetical protein [Bacteroidota bacterium]
MKKYIIILLIFNFQLLIFNFQLTAQVSFTADQYQGCPPLTVTFTNTSIVGYNYEWYFGGGNYYYGYDTSYTYTE